MLIIIYIHMIIPYMITLTPQIKPDRNQPSHNAAKVQVNTKSSSYARLLLYNRSRGSP